MVRLLLEKKVDPTRLDCYGRLALHDANSSKSLGSIRLLLNAGAAVLPLLLLLLLKLLLLYHE